jgi:hypothetical protein
MGKKVFRLWLDPKILLCCHELKICYKKLERRLYFPDIAPLFYILHWRELPESSAPIITFYFNETCMLAKVKVKLPLCLTN